MNEQRMRAQRSTSSVLSVVFKILFTGIVLFSVVFVFYHSNKVGAVSGEMSLRVQSMLNALLAKAGLGIELSHTAVRKLGHLAEFANLGFWSLLALRVYTKRLFAHISWPLLFCLGVAVCDEFVQLYVPGRSSEVRDVIIDFAGSLAGAAVALVLVLALRGFFALLQTDRE